MTTTLDRPTETDAPVSPAKPKRAKKADEAPSSSLSVVVNQEALKSALGIVGRAVGAGRMLPILNNVLLEADEAGLRLTCTDLEQRLTVTIPTGQGCRIDSPGAFTVPARLLSSLVDTLPAKPVTLLHEDTVLRVECGSKGKIKGTDASEFPDERAGNGESFTLLASTLAQAIGLTEWAVAREDKSRPVLATVCLRKSGSTLHAESADGYALSMLALDDANAPDFTALIPLKAAQTIARLCAEGDVTLTLLPSAKSPNVVRLTTVGAAPVTLTARLGEGQFPDLQRVVPTAFATTITAPREALLLLVRQVGLLGERQEAKDGQRLRVVMKLRVTPDADNEGHGTLELSGRNAEAGEYAGSLPVVMTGEAVGWSMDATYVAAYLNVMDAPESAEVVIGVAGPLLPVVFTAPALPGYTSVIMPMHVVGDSA